MQASLKEKGASRLGISWVVVDALVAASTPRREGTGGLGEWVMGDEFEAL